MKNKPILTKVHVGYVRVSTTEQANSGYSVAAQEAKIRAHAFSMDRVLDEVIIDAGESGSTLDRPGMVRLLAMIRAGLVSSVTATKLDRYTRSIVGLAELLEAAKAHKTALVSVSDAMDTSTANGRMVMNILMSVAQGERELIAERTGEVMRFKAAQGYFMGGKRARYGYRKSDEPRNVKSNGQLAAPRLVEVPEEQEKIEIVRSMRQNGASLRAIAGKTGISTMTVQRMCKKHDF